MANEKRLMSGLVEKLENVEIKLKEVKDAGIEFTPPQDKCRSFTLMKNILDTLVKKIVDGKSHSDDISLISDLPFHYEQSVFHNLISSEEYLEETKKVLSITTKPGLILHLLLNFHELLGDILYSVCEINNHKMKVPSGITVKDLIKINIKYVTLWNLISTNARPNSNQNINQSLIESQLEKKLIELQKPLQLCLKEMSKVKLEIEHYFKCNIIEMQLTNSFNDLVNIEKVNVHEKETQQSQKKTKLLLGKNYSNIKNTILDTSVNFNKKNVYNPPSTFFPKTSPEPSDSAEIGQNGHILNPSTTYVKNESGEDLFSSSYVYSHEYLLLDPMTTFTMPKIKPTRNNSLPKIYSVDSVSENVRTSMPTTYTEKLTNTQNDVTGTDNETNKYGMLENKKTIESKLSVNSSMEKDLFTDDTKMELSDSQSVELRKKISSLMDMLKENKINDNENIFDAEKLDNYNSNLSCSESGNNSSLNQKPFLDVHNLNQNIMFVEKSPKYPSTSLHQKTNKITTKQNEKYNKFFFTPFYHNRVNINHPNKIPTEEGIIHDQRSLIELFRTTNENYYSNSESCSQNGSSCMWPVAAEYIYTSKQQATSYLCPSASSDNSIPPSFGESFFSLQLKKRYEQNQKYDGDLIVLESPKRLKKVSNSSNSLFDQSNVIFDKDQQKAQKRGYSTEQHYKNCTEHSKSSTKPLYPQKGVISKLKTTIDRQKTLAVSYTNYTTPYLPNNNTFRRENFDFLKINTYDNNNWNSFISIFTSKVGPTARINHHSMFRKIINIGNETLSADNMVGNVHTLTSNGGPFRLFDINGYPLTDCAGNVLKDPYSKAVVELDSTGFPKNDIKVFDAAGNSPNDVKFDPTQKPKTNTIIIKLTDNFKRPLHLFDKYGRPLTDFNGKLLVNIHGRPLLRFDNFGRPNTDYRGGPLYTDNGFRWSYKNSESFSNEKLSNEQLIPRKLTEKYRNVRIDESCEPMNMVTSQYSALNGDLESCEVKPLQKDQLTPMNSTRSDIWVTVETVLQRLPKKNITAEPKSSQTSVIINNVTVTHGSVEKGLLKPIIYHNNFIQQDINHKTNNKFSFSRDETNLFNFNRLNDCVLKDNTLLMSDKTANDEGLLKKVPTVKYQFPFYNNILVHNTCSKCFKLTQKDRCNRQKFDYMMTNNIYGGNKTNLENTLLLESHNFSPNKEPMNLSNISNRDLFKRASINLNTNNQNYLDKLCNQILKCQIDRKARTKQYLAEVSFKDGNWTETSQSNFISSPLSKYTSESPNISESREITMGTAQKRTKANYCYGCKKQNELKTSFQNSNQSFFDKVKRFPEYFKNRGLAMKLSESNTRISEKYLEENFILSSEEEAPSVHVCNQENKSYQTNVTEKFTQELEPKRYTSSLVNNFPSKNSIEVLKPKVVKAKERHNKAQHTQTINCSKSRNLKNHNGGTRDSPYRFPSENKLQNLYPEDETKYYHNENHDLSSNKDSKINTTCINKDFKRQNMNDIKRYEDKNISCEKIPLKKGEISRNKEEMSHLKTIAAKKTECNIVSFLGSPVKYVLDKLDSKRISKPQPNCIRKSVMPTKLYRKDNKETLKIPIYGGTTNKFSEETEIKTLYFSESGKNKNSTTTVHKLKTNRSLLKQRGELIAFRSKSCDNVLNKHNYASMSYSGNEKYSNASENKLNGLITNSSDLRKCSSATSFKKGDGLKNNYHLRRLHKPEKCKYKTKNLGQQSSKPSTARKKHTIPYCDTNNNSKNNKGTIKKHPKSSTLSKNKKKEFIFFKRL